MATTTTAATINKTSSHASNVYLFKNGYGMFVKTFDFPSNKDNIDTPVELIDPPLNPVHGTFWIQPCSDKTTVTSVRTKKTRKFVDKECLSVEDLLEANVGQDVQLLIVDSITKTKEWISGQIQSVKRTQEYVSDDDDMDTTNPMHSTAIAIHPPSGIQSGNLVLFKTTDHGLQSFSLSDIQSIRGPTLKTKYQRKIMKNCLSIDYKNESGSNDTGLMKYLTFGITWAPSYNLVLLSSENLPVKRLRLSSKAVILNDIENMNVDNLFCIVGFPNISKFAAVIDPIISGKNVQEFLNHLKQCEMGNVMSSRIPQYAQQSIMSNSIMTQQMMPQHMALQPSFDNNTTDNTQQDTNVDDLHLYEFKNIVLNKKERLMLPIFDIEIPYKDIYNCKINGLRSEYIYARQDEKQPYEDVWHSVEFENISNFVWTTAPIVITKGQQEQQFIGQDTLTYTLKRSTTCVNLTKALDVRVQLEEKVLSTNQSSFVRYRVKYQTDQIEGTITVTNYKAEEVVVVINATLAGKMSNYTVAPKKDSVKANEAVANQHHDIRWEVNIKPKQKLEMTYIRLYNKRI